MGGSGYSGSSANSSARNFSSVGTASFLTGSSYWRETIHFSGEDKITREWRKASAWSYPGSMAFLSGGCY